ncbi:MAG TPA: transketolase [Candidatus Thermoplasmatota archaeon]|nr:transketolase [Candidatus Thermoplasmatota archaeon]
MDLREVAREVRVDVLRMTHAAGSGHPGGSMSMADLVVGLYWGPLRHDPSDPAWEGRDRFVLSKGHCCPGLYSVLARRGYFPVEELAGFRKLGQRLQGHADRKVPGVEMSAGSLGMGLAFGNGVALAARLRHADDAAGELPRVYVMLGDGEVQEGSVWEAAMSAAHRGLDNLCAILDYNKIQIDGFVADVKGIEPLGAKWRAFGWHVVEIDGHDPAQIQAAYAEASATKGKPTLVLAHTLKGKGVSFTENKAEYHGRALTDDEMRRAMAELGRAP